MSPLPDTLRIGVVGCGRFGARHADCYGSIAGAVLAAVCDVDPAKARRAGRTYGVPAFATLADLAGRVDAVSVVVALDELMTVARACLSYGLHVLVEKPLGSTLAGSEELCRLAEGAGLTLEVGYVERFHPAVAAAGALVPRPTRLVAERLSLFTHSAATTDIVLDLMSHDIDHCLRLFPAPLLAISAHAAQAPRGSVNHEMQAVLGFADGSRAELSASRTGLETRRTLRIENAGNFVTADLLTGELVHDGICSHVPLGNPLRAQLSAFVGKVRLGPREEVGGWGGVRVLDIALRIIAQSALAGGATLAAS